MTQGQVVVMEKSLEEAFAKMIERVKVETGRIDRRFAPLISEPKPALPQPVQIPFVTTTTTGGIPTGGASARAAPTFGSGREIGVECRDIVALNK